MRVGWSTCRYGGPCEVLTAASPLQRRWPPRVPPPSLALQAEYVRSRTFAPKADLAAAREMFAHALWDGHAHKERPGGSGMIVADEALSLIHI